MITMLLVGALALLAPAAIFGVIASLCGIDAAAATFAVPFGLLTIFGLSKGLR